MLSMAKALGYVTSVTKRKKRKGEKGLEKGRKRERKKSIK